MQKYRSSTWLLFLGVFLITIGFVSYTNHAWEDWYITFRASKNLALGNGLVYTPGEHLHTFTSPIGTLIPAFLSYLVGPTNDDLVLWLFRVIGAVLLGFSAVILLESARKNKLNPLAIVLLLALLALDAKTVDFSTNGMETAFMIFFLSLLVYALTVPTKQPVYWLGITIAGLMWSRPDSFVHIGAVMLGYLVFNPETQFAHTRKEWLFFFIRAGLLGLALYLPWILWAWWYYGTPIPNTITAKGLSSVGSGSFNGRFLAEFLLKQFVLFPFNSLAEVNSLSATFSPAYYVFGGWNQVVPTFSKLFTFISISYWVLPFARRSIRPWSLAAYLVQFYLSHVTPFCYPWYIPSATFLSIWVLALAFDQLIDWVRLKRPSLTPALKGIAGVAIAFQLILLLCVAYQMRIQQQTIELSNRKAIGTWLRTNAKPGSTVFLECLGYIGFYSNLKMYDFPGLSSDEVIRARKALRTTDYNKLITYLKPDYLVIRPLDNVNKTVLGQYEAVKRYDVTDKVWSYQFLPGREYLQIDQVFTIYRRKTPLGQELSLR